MGGLMKSILLVAMFLSSALASAHTFKCYPSKSNPEAFLAGGYALLELDGDQLRFQQYDTVSGETSLLRDYVYSFERIKAGKSRVRGMMEYRWKETIKDYGDLLGALYLNKRLADGKNGALIFAGHGYSWDWNYCRVQQ